jgi:hypothetical protein
MAALPRIVRRCRDPAGPPSPARPDRPGERGTVAVSREGGTTFTITFGSDHGEA